jgi:hypothetical protein
MPKSIRLKNLKAIVKASGPGDITSLSSPATSSDGYLIIFPKGFLNSDQLPRTIFHELSHFMIGREWKRQFSNYREVSGVSPSEWRRVAKMRNRFFCGRFHLLEPGNFSDRSHRSVSDVMFN